MPQNKNKAVSTKSTLAGSGLGARCPRCGNGTNDLEAHRYQLPSTVTAADMHTQYRDACRDS